ncbi:MAG: M28 family peptidase [Halobacteriales archaeon]|nr:M28 family peptidase [Halobacteriales archaeon]
MSSAIADPDSLTGIESELVDEIAVDEPWQLLEEFRHLERVSGSEDERKAAEYITDRLDALGVEYSRYDPELYISQPHGAEIEVLNWTMEMGPVKTVAFAADRTVSGEVEYIGEIGSDLGGGQSTVENEDALSEVEGKIVLTEAGSLSIRANTILEEAGAIGVIAIHKHRREPHNGIATPVWGGAPPLDEKDRIPDIPIANINAPDGEILKDWAESDEGLEVELSTDLTTDWMECPIVVAEIEGQADPDNDDFVLLHGHYDSWYVGITDNATGDAGLLECARVFDQFADRLDRNLRVAWWPGHSTGRYAGSTWYADEYAIDLAENCVAQVNMDSPGAKDSAEYTDMSCWTPEAHEHVGEAIEDVTGAPYAEEHPHRAGDYSFDNLGITGFFMLSSNIPTEERERRGYHSVGGCGGNSDAWHVSTDTIDKAGKDELVRDIRLYAVSVLRVLNADILPFNHTRNARKLLESVEEYDAAAGDAFDFTPTIEELNTLIGDLETFYEKADAGDIDPSVANEVITDLSRILTRLNLVKDGQFEQDPAVGRQPFPKYAPAEQLPSLEGNDRRFLKVQLKREQNDVVYKLRRAQELIAEAL